jgi:hypothetical protein
MTRIIIDIAELRESARNLRSAADGLLDVANRLGAEPPPAISAHLSSELTAIRTGVSTLSVDIVAGARDLDLRAHAVEEAGTRWWAVSQGRIECCCRLPNGQVAIIRTNAARGRQGPTQFRSVTLGAVRTAASSASGPGVSGTITIGGGAPGVSGTAATRASSATISIGGGNFGVTGTRATPASGGAVLIGGGAPGVSGTRATPGSSATISIGGGNWGNWDDRQIDFSNPNDPLNVLARLAVNPPRMSGNISGWAQAFGAQINNSYSIGHNPMYNDQPDMDPTWTRDYSTDATGARIN